MIYILPVFFTLLCVFFYDLSNNQKGRTFSYTFLFVYLTALSGLSYKIGSDTLDYMDEFNETITISKLSIDDLVILNRQPGWVFFLSFCKSICNDYAFFKIIFAIILNSTVFLFIKHYAKWPFVALLLYELGNYLPMNFETMRESLAVSFAVLSFMAIEKNKTITFILFCIIAFLFHISAIVLIIVPFVLKVRITFKRAILVFPLLILTSFAMKILMSHLEVVLLYLSGDMLKSAEYYTAIESTGIPHNFILVFGLEYILFLYLVKEGNCKQWILQLFVISLILTMVGKFVPITYRFSRYFTVINYVCLAEMFIVLYYKQLKGLPRNIIVVLLVLLFSYSSLKGLYEISETTGHRQIDYYYPYHSIL